MDFILRQQTAHATDPVEGDTERKPWTEARERAYLKDLPGTSAECQSLNASPPVPAEALGEIAGSLERFHAPVLQ